jgi:hypothetical protein
MENNWINCVKKFLKKLWKGIKNIFAKIFKKEKIVNENEKIPLLNNTQPEKNKNNKNKSKDKNKDISSVVNPQTPKKILTLDEIEKLNNLDDDDNKPNIKSVMTGRLQLLTDIRDKTGDMASSSKKFQNTATQLSEKAQN